MREAAGNDGAFDNPQSVRILAAASEGGVVGLNGVSERVAGLPQGARLKLAVLIWELSSAGHQRRDSAAATASCNAFMP